MDTLRGIDSNIRGRNSTSTGHPMLNGEKGENHISGPMAMHGPSNV